MSARLDAVQVGAPPGRLSGWMIAPVHFNGFAGLPTTKDLAVHSPEFSCFGHQWEVAMYPGGGGGVVDSEDGFVALWLVNKSAEAIGVHYKLVSKHPAGGQDIWGGSTSTMRQFSNMYSGNACFGHPNFARRSTLMNYLVDGTLIVEVHLRTNKPGQQSAPFVPENPFLRNAMLDFGDEETADVKLEVGAVQRSGRRKRGRTSTTTFHAHHFVLRRNAPALADMCTPGADSAPTTISNVRPEIFKHVLYYCYGGKIDEEDLQSNASEILEAADRFDIVNLKLEAEACYVETVELTVDDIIETITYADSKNLALLKEHCMDFLGRADKAEVAEKVSFDDMPSRLMTDLMVAMARSERKSSRGDELSMMRVSDLRRLAHEKGLGVDGSREMLIASLKDDDVVIVE
ncbi:hypothetical protein THAOC_36123 [Thalassiosira oceanica]|uniref:SAP domain-containing protein n=1 Tax=Thalassiosira oceanica TaxID=159749 RepID=K0R0R5_THAOC|nr:hypothetical protein THAOC_36123 [Thalassiosira oceanica]|eukprot:EJK45265.1 hypothetical protein THAOC_36123 [Thalassiosira oceanica]